VRALETVAAILGVLANLTPFDSVLLPLPSLSLLLLPKVGTEGCTNTESLGEVEVGAKDNDEEVNVTILIKEVEGTAIADITEAEVSVKSEDSKILVKAKRGFSLDLFHIT
jgi:hypothetical protein